MQLLHDELSNCYNKKLFRDFVILDKETFDSMHGLIFDYLTKKFYESGEEVFHDYNKAEKVMEFVEEEGQLKSIVVDGGKCKIDFILDKITSVDDRIKNLFNSLERD